MEAADVNKLSWSRRLAFYDDVFFVGIQTALPNTANVPAELVRHHAGMFNAGPHRTYAFHPGRAFGNTLESSDKIVMEFVPQFDLAAAGRIKDKLAIHKDGPDWAVVARFEVPGGTSEKKPFGFSYEPEKSRRCHLNLDIRGAANRFESVFIKHLDGTDGKYRYFRIDAEEQELDENNVPRKFVVEAREVTEEDVPLFLIEAKCKSA